jgi:lipopolysaccharide transport system permease protein
VSTIFREESPERWDMIIEAGRTERHYWRDLWNYRDLFSFLAWRDILVRYKQTVFGVAWAIARPVLTMIVFSVIFGRVAKLPSEGLPYPILVFAGMLPWQFFSTSFSQSGNSLVGNVNLISKIYFPRLIIPVSKTLVSFIDFALAFAIDIVLMLYYDVSFTWRLLTLPGFLLLAFVTAIGPGLLIASLNVRYRDFRIIVPFLVQFGLYISPVGFSAKLIPPQWQFVYSFNPMVGVIGGFRWALLAQGDLDARGLLITICVAAVLLTTGLIYFRGTERTFADVI